MNMRALLVEGYMRLQAGIYTMLPSLPFKYHVSCTDGKISIGIILIAYFSTVVSLTSCLPAWAVDSWSLNLDYFSCWI